MSGRTNRNSQKSENTALVRREEQNSVRLFMAVIIASVFVLALVFAPAPASSQPASPTAYTERCDYMTAGETCEITQDDAAAAVDTEPSGWRGRGTGDRL